MRRLPILLPALAFLVLVGSASGAITLNSVNSTWDDWVVQSASSNVNLSSDGSEQKINWGVSAGYGQTSLGFTGDTPAEPLEDGDIFRVGVLRHYNKPIGLNSGITSVDLDLSLDFGGAPVNTSLTLLITESTTGGNDGGAGDTIVFPTSYEPVAFEVGGTEYQLCLLGFGCEPDGPYAPSLSTNERCIGAIGLWGQVCETTVPIPAPGAFLLAGLGAGVVGWLRQRKSL